MSTYIYIHTCVYVYMGYVTRQHSPKMSSSYYLTFFHWKVMSFAVHDQRRIDFFPSGFDLNLFLS